MNHLLRELVQVVDPGAKIPHWGMQMLRLGLRLHLNSPVTHLSQKLTHLEVRRTIIEYQDDFMTIVTTNTHDLTLSEITPPGSDEGRPNINELMAICTNLSNRVLALETSKTAQYLVIKKLKKKVKRLEKKLRARTPGMKLFKIEGNFDDDFDNIDDMVNEAMEQQYKEKYDKWHVKSTSNNYYTAFEDEYLYHLLKHFKDEKFRRKRKKEKERKGCTRKNAKGPGQHKKKHLNDALTAEFDDVQARMDADALLAARL
ncbi:hypothetical protein Tco_0422271 [Tanacetum coccineum]